MEDNAEGMEATSKFINWIRQINPVVPKHWLLLVAGLMWTGVGILLISLAVTWLLMTPSLASLLIGVLGVGIGIIANRFQFTHLAVKNIKRILSLKDKASVFSFQAWTGYLIIAVMMTTGILLRNSSIPKLYLAVVYLAIGSALFLASTNYYKHFFHIGKSKDQ